MISRSLVKRYESLWIDGERTIDGDGSIVSIVIIRYRSKTRFFSFQYPPKPLPVPPPTPQYDVGKGKPHGEMEDEEITLQDAPSLEYAKKQFDGEVPYSGKPTEAMKGPRRYGPKEE